jgi:hypothetical protein
MLRIASTLVWTLALAVSAHAGLGEVLAAAKGGDFATASKETRSPAVSGHGNVQPNSGVIYRKGVGGPNSDAEATKRYRFPVKQGFVLAQLDIENKYAKGGIVKAQGTVYACNSVENYVKLLTYILRGKGQAPRGKACWILPKGTEIKLVSGPVCDQTNQICEFSKSGFVGFFHPNFYTSIQAIKPK